MRNPVYLFGQFVCVHGTNPFYMEDDEAIKKIEKFSSIENPDKPKEPL